MEAQPSIPSAPDELETLVQVMTPVQKLRFKQAVVRQAIHFVSKHLPPAGEDDGHRSGIIAATNWLNEPTEEQAKNVAAYATSECWDGGVRYHDYPASFLDPAWTAAQPDVCAAAQLATHSAPPMEQEAAYQWQIASAQAILRGQELSPPEGKQAEALLLYSPDQLPELEGETLILIWDQIEADSLILHGDAIIWREKTGWEVYDRFEEIAVMLKQKYGKRLIDIVPTPRSRYALYGDSTAAYFHVTYVRESLSE